MGADVVLGDNGRVEFDAGGNLALARNEDSSIGGSDNIDTGAGNDVALGGGAGDTLQGGAGNDILMGDGGFVTYSAGDLSMIEGDSSVGGADTLIGGSGNDVILGGFGADTMDGNLAEDLLFGDNARIHFSGGMVTSIEILGQMDFVMQTLFDLYANGGEKATGLPLADVQEILAMLPVQGDLDGDDDLVTPQIALTPGGISLIFGRSEPLAALPAALRNLLIDLVLAHPHSGTGGSSDEMLPPETGGEKNDGQGPEEVTAAVDADMLASVATADHDSASQVSTPETDWGAAPSLALATLVGTPALRKRVFEPVGGRAWGKALQRPGLIQPTVQPAVVARASVPLEWLVSDEQGDGTEVRAFGQSRVDWHRNAA
jgi:hypothetical protein